MILPPELPPLDTIALLRRTGIRPEKSKGQNFLMDETVLRKIVAAAEINNEDVVLEVGPGLGSLTRYLAATAKKVVAVELDPWLIPPLEGVMAPWNNVTIIQGSILDFIISEIVEQENYLVVANIPYYITSAIMRHLMENSPRPKRIVLTMQKEVAERVCSKPGDMSLLALSVQVYGAPEIAARIPAGAFYPAPKVDSAVLKVNLYAEPLIPLEQINTFFRLTKAGFSQKRKTLRNALSGGLAIPAASAEALLKASGIDPMRRAETLSIPEWKVVCDEYVKTKMQKE
jgi:16S rRNA (adenine1518-N6/adenine1519-N6)-dimethyltransferase